MHAARLADVTAEIDSDVQDWSMHPAPEDEHPLALGFPLGSRPGGGAARLDAYLCTQGENGGLTHFFSGNLHAVDFRCPVGCEVLAVADAEVVEVRDEETVTGIATANLFRWNSVMLKVDAPDADDEKPNGGDLYVEYVHVAARSFASPSANACDGVKRSAKAGASDSRPSRTCTSQRSGRGTRRRPPCACGSPPSRGEELTLKINLQRNQRARAPPDAASAKSANASSDASSDDGATFSPVAGRWYDAAGEAPAPRDS